MTYKLMLASLLAFGVAAAAIDPAQANSWTYSGPHGAQVTHWGPTPYHGYCCYGGGVAAGAAAGLAVGTAIGVAAASHPVYAAPPPVVYYAPPPVAYFPPPVVVAPGGYYVAP